MSFSDALTEQWMDELRSGIKKKFLEELKKLPPESLDDVVRGGLNVDVDRDRGLSAKRNTHELCGGAWGDSGSK